uniref:Transmembrane protein 170B n=1 Tax=Gallus gallus TaxID=9031 RepID=A0A8V0Y9R4_CHICK
MNWHLLVKLESKKKMHRQWKQGQVPWAEHRDAPMLCRDKARKAKAQLELDLARGVKKKKKDFKRYINRKREVQENKVYFSSYPVSSTEMWYWVFLWALFSSLFVHGAVGVLMFVMLQRHRQGRLISVIVVSIGFLGSVTGAMITSAAVAGIYRVAGKNMAPLEALVFGVGQTVLTLIISFSRILATL